MERSFDNLIARLEQASFHRDFVRKILIPDWCCNAETERGFLPEFEFMVGRFLKLKIEDVRDYSKPIPHCSIPIARAYEQLAAHPSLDSSYLIHLLWVCVAYHAVLVIRNDLPEALQRVPMLLKDQTIPETDLDTLELARKIVEVAREDERCLQNYLDGNPMESFL